MSDHGSSLRDTQPGAAKSVAKPMGRQGRLPFGDAQTVDDAVFCLRYILGQIEGCRTYRPNIGQVNSATSGLRIAIAELARVSAQSATEQVGASASECAQ